MKSKNTIIGLLASIAFIITLSCSKEVANDVTQEQDLTAFEKKMVEIRAKVSNTISYNRAPVIYLEELCGDVIAASHLGGTSSIADPTAWDWYYFNGTAGDVISIEVLRTTPEMDPAFSLFEGMTDSTDDNVNVFYGGDDMNMTWVAHQDDPDPFPEPFNPCFYDPPVLTYMLLSSGAYTLAVFDAFGCVGPKAYEIHTMGINCNADPDTDGDGCLDSVDPHPNSIVDPTIVIDGCDSGVANVFIGCSTMSDLIADCADAAVTHGDFVSCVAALTNEWKSAGLISGGDKGDIIGGCAAGSNIPYP